MTQKAYRSARRGGISLALACLALCATGAAQAEDYTIQIGAFSTPSDRFAASARSEGTLYYTARDGGMVALSIGRYASFAAAQNQLAQLQDSYPDAYVRRADPDAAQRWPGGGAGIAAETASATRAARGSAARRTNAPDDAILATLSEAERKNVVYLDGKLHVKEGNRFTPLREYQRSRP
ncbi:MAG: SPOR domain-containing protein [Pseudomonadota bacterium]